MAQVGMVTKDIWGKKALVVQYIQDRWCTLRNTGREKKERKYNSISICVYKINQFCRKSEKGLHSSTFAGLKSDDTYNEGRCSE